MSNNSWWQYLPELWERAHGVCHYCGTFTIPARLVPEIEGAVLTKKGRVVLWRGCYWSVASVDHVVPRRDGGTNRRKNLVLACVQCNGRRNKQNASQT